MNQAHTSSLEATTVDQTRAFPVRRVVLGCLYLIAVGSLLYLLVDGWSYYTTDLAERAHHPDYRSLRPAGSRGLLYGVIGSSLMILMLLYTMQKRLRLFGRRFSLRPFLDFHIFCGVIGPLFIVLHTSFKVQGLVAVSFWSMVAVALSGYLGRYLYQQIPRNMDDQALSLKEIDTLSDSMQQTLKEKTGLDDDTLASFTTALERTFTPRRTQGIGLFGGLILKDIARPFTIRRLRRRMLRTRRIPRRDVDTLFEIATARALLKRRLRVLDSVQHYFHYWHVIHKPFAIVMYLIMIVHIGVAVWTGYAWIN